MRVAEIKQLIKQNRPKGQVNKYPITGKNKRELVYMLEHLISLKE